MVWNYKLRCELTYSRSDFRFLSSSFLARFHSNGCVTISVGLRKETNWRHTEIGGSTSNCRLFAKRCENSTRLDSTINTFGPFKQWLLPATNYLGPLASGWKTSGSSSSAGSCSSSVKYDSSCVAPINHVLFSCKASAMLTFASLSRWRTSSLLRARNKGGANLHSLSPSDQRL